MFQNRKSIRCLYSIETLNNMNDTQLCYSNKDWGSSKEQTSSNLSCPALASASSFSFLILLASSSSILLAFSLASPATLMLVTKSNPSLCSFVSRSLLSSICFRDLLNSSFTSCFSRPSCPSSALPNRSNFLEHLDCGRIMPQSATLFNSHSHGLLNLDALSNLVKTRYSRDSFLATFLATSHLTHPLFLIS